MTINYQKYTFLLSVIGFIGSVGFYLSVLRNLNESSLENESNPISTMNTSKPVPNFQLPITPYYHRAFLNLQGKESNAYISVGMKPDDWDGYTIKITDCEEQILLHGSLNKKESRTNAMHKIDTLIESLNLLKAEMEKEFTRLNVSH